MSIAVIGLGYVGLNLASSLIRAGFDVFGIDTSEKTVLAVNSMQVAEDVLPKDRQVNLMENGFSASTDSSKIKVADVVLICVPTPLDHNGQAVITHVQKASETVAINMKNGVLVILESTVYPGTTEGLVKTILETSGMLAEKDFNLGFSSERVDPGNLDFGLENTPKILAALSEQGLRRMEHLYSKVSNRLVCTLDVKAAELSKLLENSYRLLNIAMVNEFARVFAKSELNLRHAIDLAATKPFGFQPFYPTAGAGGHCIPVDPVFLIEYLKGKTDYSSKSLLELAIGSNKESVNQVCKVVITEFEKLLSKDELAQILIVGVTYKPNSSDTRESPGIEVIKQLSAKGFKFRYFDPHVERLEIDGWTDESIGDLSTYFVSPTLVIYLQPHDKNPTEEILSKAEVVFDATHKLCGSNVRRV